LSGRGLCDELITRPEESYRLCCVVVCDLETSRMGDPYIYDISRLSVKLVGRPVGTTAAPIPRRVTQTPEYVKELKLVCFGGFKIQFGFCYFGIPGRLSSKCFSIHR
jgi:hypothetical protein